MTNYFAELASQEQAATSFVEHVTNCLDILDWNLAKEHAVESGIIEPSDYTDTPGQYRKNYEGNADGTDVHDNWYLVQMSIAIRRANDFAGTYREEQDVRLMLKLAELAFAEGHETLATDEPCMMWHSPWSETCSSPVEFVTTVLAFDLENDEAGIVLETYEDDSVRPMNETERGKERDAIREYVSACDDIGAKRDDFHRLDGYIEAMEDAAFASWYEHLMES